MTKDDTSYAVAQVHVGWQVYPHYAYGGPVIAATRDEVENLLEVAILRWQQKVLHQKRDAITMQEVLIDRFIQRIERGSWGPRFYFADGTHVSLQRTRGYATPVMDGPTEGPFLIKRILATQRTFRLDDGRSLVFDSKMELDKTSVPEWIINQVFSD